MATFPTPTEITIDGVVYRKVEDEPQVGWHDITYRDKWSDFKQSQRRALYWDGIQWSMSPSRRPGFEIKERHIERRSFIGEADQA